LLDRRNTGWMRFSVIMNSGKQHELSVKTSRPAEPDRKPIDMIAGHDAPLISIQNPHFAHNFKLQIRTAVLTDPCEGMTGDPVRATAQPAEDQKRII
jgi:hypothetical protein